VSRFFINRPIVAMVIAIVLVLAGAVMILRLPVAQFPEIVPPKIQTSAVYTGADALTVEQSVATPIEEQVNGAKNMIYMQSINGDDGTMTLEVSFDVGTNVDIDQVQVQNRLAQATSSLPAAVSNYGLTTQQTVRLVATIALHLDSACALSGTSKSVCRTLPGMPSISCLPVSCSTAGYASTSTPRAVTSNGF